MSMHKTINYYLKRAIRVVTGIIMHKGSTLEAVRQSGTGGIDDLHVHCMCPM